MQAQPWFKDWFNSPYYHQLYFNRDEAEAALFIDKLIAYLQARPGACILDVACGKGRHSIHLAQKGFDVTGIDLSEDSIKEALRYQTDKLHFYLHDMRLPFWINYYDYAFNCFTSFGYFSTRREHDNAIRTISQSIKKDGSFVMDYLNVHYAEDHLVHQFDKEIDGVNYFITKWFDETHFYKKIIVEDDNLQEPLVYHEKLHKFSLGDFNDMFSFHHLQIQQVFGDYGFADYHLKKSPRLIIMGKKIV